MRIRLFVLAALLTMTSSTTAFAIGKGGSMLAVQITNGTADLALGASAGYITATSVPEIGVQGQYWSMMADDYALAIAAGFGFSNEKDEPGNSAPLNAPDVTYKTSSVSVRVGGDRVVKVGDRALMFGGPGIEFSTGKAKFESGGVSSESGSTKQISISTRIGAVIVLNESVGLTAHIGHRVGRASADDKGAKATWWASGFEGAMGLNFTFGKK